MRSRGLTLQISSQMIKKQQIKNMYIEIFLAEFYSMFSDTQKAFGVRCNL